MDFDICLMQVLTFRSWFHLQDHLINQSINQRLFITEGSSRCDLLCNDIESNKTMQSKNDDKEKYKHNEDSPTTRAKKY